MTSKSRQYEKLALVDDDSRSSLDFENERDSPRPHWLAYRKILLLCVAQVLFLVAYTAAVLNISAIYTACAPRVEDFVKSPATEALHWEEKYLDTRLKQDNIYTGEPSDALDEAWGDLIGLSNIKIPVTALEPLGKHSIRLPNETDLAWVSLGVMHELHCLRRLRHSLYREYYHPNMTEEELKLDQVHSAHCIDYLRQVSMCRGDVSLTTYYFVNKDRLPVADFDAPHGCVNWDSLAAWQKERVFNPMEPGWLQHPNLGPAYPDGEGTALGVSPDQLED